MNKNWYAVLTADVLYSKVLTDRQKILLAVISNMSNEKGYCFASNSYFSEMLGVSIRSIQTDIKALEDNKFLGRVVKLKPNGDIEYRALTPCNLVHTPMKDSSPPHEENFTPPCKILHHNNKVNNIDKNKNNNIPIINFGEFNSVMLEWLSYRKEIKKPYKSQKSIELVYKNLLSLSVGSVELAGKIVSQSIANGWTGLFELKGKTIANNQEAVKPKFSM